MNIATYVLIGDLPRIPNDTQIGPNKSTPLVANGLVLIKRSVSYPLFVKLILACIESNLHIVLRPRYIRG